MAQFDEDFETAGTLEEFTARAEEVITPELGEALMAASEATFLMSAMQESPEAMADFLEGAVKAIYNDGRAKAGKEAVDSFDASGDVDALMLGTLIGIEPVEAILGAFGSVYVKGYDS